MIARTDDRPTLVAHVDPDLCVSCGICSGSCAPMGVGPAGRTGRDQLAEAHAFLDTAGIPTGGIVVVGCDHGAGRSAAAIEAAGATFRPVSCAGNLHTSVIERFIRAGAGGVLILACPPRDCWTREGPRWLNERVYHDREAELQARVPRARVRIAHVNAHEGALALAALRAFAADVAALEAPAGQEEPMTEPVCDPPVEEEVSK
jgi:coenzyme F420-reducing hydrogenase delta subunit